MLKNFFLYLSTQRTLRRWMENSAAARVLSRRFIAGNRLEDGLAVVRDLKARGILTALDHLGENVKTEAEAEAARRDAMAALQGAIAEQAGATISIKLTQFGLDISRRLTVGNVRPLVELAGSDGSRVEVDMEATPYTQKTVEILEELKGYGPVRCVLQAYLYRTAADVERMNAAGVPVRLCKGAYNEPAELAMARKSDVDENFKKQAARLLEKGAYPAFATHDPAMINHVLGLRPGKEDIEFQMLYGIRRDLQERLVNEGWRVRLYVPYGEAWYPYFMRRLAERPANVWFLMRGMLR